MSKIKEKLTPHLLILPSILAFALFMFWPLIRTVYLSFFSWNMVKPTKTFVGLSNYIEIFNDPLTYKIMGNTFLYIIILLLVNFVAPYILSLISSMLGYILLITSRLEKSFFLSLLA